MIRNDGGTVIDVALKYLAGQAPVQIRIRGNCMAPLIRDGETVLVEARKQYWPGDVLVLRTGGDILVAHRLIGCYRKGGKVKLVTRADNGIRPDAATTPDRIIGAVCSGNRGGERLRVPLTSRVRSIVRFVRYSLRRLVWSQPDAFRRTFSTFPRHLSGRRQ